MDSATTGGRGVGPTVRTSLSLRARFHALSPAVVALTLVLPVSGLRFFCAGTGMRWNNDTADIALLVDSTGKDKTGNLRS